MPPRRCGDGQRVNFRERKIKDDSGDSCAEAPGAEGGTGCQVKQDNSEPDNAQQIAARHGGTERRGKADQERAARPAKPHIVLRGGDIRKALRHGSWRGLGAHTFSLGNAAVKEELTWRT